MKRVLCIVLAIAVLATIFWVLNPFSPATEALAEEFRNGYSLLPQSYDSTGIKTDSSFVLKSQYQISQDFLVENLKLEGIELTIIAQEDNSFKITPNTLLQKNKLYRFTLNTGNSENVSWVFQTCSDFAIIGSLPGNQTTNVPVNTGIEIYFTHSGYEDIEKYFEITPNAKGRFEIHGHTAVFVSTDLKPGTVYNIKVKKGLPIENSTQFLQEDYTFSFETQPKESINNNFIGSFNYTSFLSEFSTLERPMLPINFYLNHMDDSNNKENSITISTNIYAYNSFDSFIDALENMESTPIWAYYNRSKNLLETKNLELTSSFEQNFQINNWEDRVVQVPNTLK